ncbi:PREDICTED: uncharacterized protein LOC109164691 [Ipomoea nil]|uniref:uncharacterized protein LOC109164691 n=1 Tax=Ipomoea nil TaxID=35883 RepID=UPI000901B1FC|nr:PREDICTED: uncharacterized protein LOC109164691 [Ipomoea nil]
MGMMLAGKTILARISGKFRPVLTRSFCSGNKPPANNNNKEVLDPSSSSSTSSSSLTRYDAYKELENLNFMSAAKILFTEPSKKKKFGLDFHLVQLFFACLPSLAVYLVAQYARYEIRRMEAEVELKKQAEEEAKAKEMEEMAEVEKEEASEPQLLELKARLDKLEEAVKEIVVESRKESPDAIGKGPKIGGQDKQPISGESNTSKSPQAGNSDAKDYPNTKTSWERTGKTDAPSS